MRTEVLLEILIEAQSLGFLGPGDPASHISHALGFADAALVGAGAPSRFADLGTGGGVPGLVLAECGRRGRGGRSSSRRFGAAGPSPHGWRRWTSATGCRCSRVAPRTGPAIPSTGRPSIS